MKGSEKQLRWAEDIIARVYGTLDNMIANGYDVAAVEAARKDLQNTFAQVDNAAMIIDIRGKLSPATIEATVIHAYHACVTR